MMGSKISTDAFSVDRKWIDTCHQVEQPQLLGVQTNRKPATHSLLENSGKRINVNRVPPDHENLEVFGILVKNLRLETDLLKNIVKMLLHPRAIANRHRLATRGIDN